MGGVVPVLVFYVFVGVVSANLGGLIVWTALRCDDTLGGLVYCRATYGRSIVLW